jgi:hypothetical protein
MGEAKRRRQHLADHNLIEIASVNYLGKLFHIKPGVIEGLLNNHNPDHPILSVVSSPEECQLIQEVLWNSLDRLLEKYGSKCVTYAVHFDTRRVLHTQQAILRVFPHDWLLDPSGVHDYRLAMVIFESAEKRLVEAPPGFFEKHDQN